MNDEAATAAGWSGNVIPAFDRADRMRKALQVAGISQTQIATELDVTRATVNRWLNGRTKPTRAALIAWALATGVHTTWLITGEADMRSAQDAAILSLPVPPHHPSSRRGPTPT